MHTFPHVWHKICHTYTTRYYLAHHAIAQHTLRLGPALTYLPSSCLASERSNIPGLDMVSICPVRTSVRVRYGCASLHNVHRNRTPGHRQGPLIPRAAASSHCMIVMCAANCELCKVFSLPFNCGGFNFRVLNFNKGKIVNFFLVVIWLYTIMIIFNCYRKLVRSIRAYLFVNNALYKCCINK